MIKAQKLIFDVPKSLMIQKTNPTFFQRTQMQNCNLLAIAKCFNGCRDHTQVSGFGTRVWNLSDRPVELQIRVGSILKKVHTLKPGSSKRLKSKKIYKAYVLGGDGSVGGKGGGSAGGTRNFLYYYDETCHPYIWVHDNAYEFSRMVRQQYISLEDLKECLEIKIFRDHVKGSISIRKKPRPDFC
ncbi:hypothetical protein L1987_01293 [Smallanthus sonchifolius]|uniref:Uncharacterized protein n=1 Tax=Smallanthus sonchifolius TaxID=185202 RepID=A0ACB9K4G5_9ASTR|nr:hypothetical protein L1987_01293 [Smallanthus sonchifolius]